MLHPIPINYEAIVNAPKDCALIGVAVVGVDNVAVYRGYEVYEDKKRTNDCCAVPLGMKKDTILNFTDDLF